LLKEELNKDCANKHMAAYNSKIILGLNAFNFVFAENGSQNSASINRRKLGLAEGSKISGRSNLSREKRIYPLKPFFQALL
jgi:hypothetical protein